MTAYKQNFKKRILCYGDSNTYGFIPFTNLRYDDETRWPMVLQQELGNEYIIIEEGLNGRTSGFDEEDGIFPEKLLNSSKTIRTVINSHRPLNYVIIMLGANDIKNTFNTTPEITTKNLLNLVHTIKEYGVYNNQSPKIVLCTLPYLHEKVAEIWQVFEGRLSLIEEINKIIRQIKTKDLFIFDTYLLSQDSSEDGAHFSPKSHFIIGNAMKNLIESI